MSFAERHKKGTIDWGINTDDFEYFSLKDLYEMNGPDQEYVVKGVYINKKKSEQQLKDYGVSPVAILEDKLVNLPNHMASEIEEILTNEEDIADIKAEKAVFKIRTYESHGKTCYSPDWQEVEQ